MGRCRQGRCEEKKRNVISIVKRQSRVEQAKTTNKCVNKKEKKTIMQED